MHPRQTEGLRVLGYVINNFLLSASHIGETKGDRSTAQTQLLPSKTKNEGLHHTL